MSGVGQHSSLIRVNLLLVKTNVKYDITAAAKSTKMKFKKAPDAPKRFKSAFIFFSSEKHKEIRCQMKADGISAAKVNAKVAFRCPSTFLVSDSNCACRQPMLLNSFLKLGKT